MKEILLDKLEKHADPFVREAVKHLRKELAPPPPPPPEPPPIDYTELCSTYDELRKVYQQMMQGKNVAQDLIDLKVRIEGLKP